MNSVAEAESLSGLIWNWRQAHKAISDTSVNLTEFESRAETLFDNATAVLYVLEEQLKQRRVRRNLNLKSAERGAQMSSYSFQILGCIIGLRVWDTLMLDDEDDDQDEEGVATYGGPLDSDLYGDWDNDEVSIWHEQRIYLHLKHPQRFFFWARTECVFAEEEPGSFEIIASDVGNEAASILARLSQMIINHRP